MKDCIEHPNEPDSPVLTAMGGRGTLYSIIHHEENTRKMDALRLEISSNEKLLEGIVNCCERNQALRLKEKKAIGTLKGTLLRIAAAENLYTNRYLDVKETFYDELGNYFDNVTALNRHLMDWRSNEKRVEKSLIKYAKAAQSDIAKLKKYVERTK